jgi:hypothetical protein
VQTNKGITGWDKGKSRKHLHYSITNSITYDSDVKKNQLKPGMAK